MLSRVVLFSLLLLVAFDTASAQPWCEGQFTWGYCPPAKPDERNAQAEERGSEQIPAFIKVIPPEPSQEQQQREKAKGEVDRRLVDLTSDLSTYTLLLFLATAGLGLFTAGLVFVGFKQVRDARAGIDAAQKSAAAAETALVVLGRPFVFGNAHFNNDRVTITIYNFGKTPAFLTRFEYNIAAIDKGGIIPSIDPINIGGRSLPVGTVADKGDPFKESTNLSADVTHDDMARQQRSLWVTGFIRYADIFGNHHITGFTLVFDDVGDRFVRRGGAAYNYARSEKKGEIPEPSSDS